MNQDRKKQMKKQEQEHLSEMQVVESQFTLKQASALRTIGQHQHQLDAMRAQFKAVSNKNDQHVLEISDLKHSLAELQDQSTEASLTHASALLETTAQMKKNKAPALDKSPQKKGTCLKVFTVTPRKPSKNREFLQLRN